LQGDGRGGDDQAFAGGFGQGNGGQAVATVLPVPVPASTATTAASLLRRPSSSTLMVPNTLAISAIIKRWP